MSYKQRYHSDWDYSGEPRHLLVFLDGTWNDENGYDGDGLITNIRKLFLSLEGECQQQHIPHVIQHEQHVALYFRGIGNDEDNDTLGSYYQGLFGAGEKRIRDHAYCEIIKHYRQGDKISLMGFSRGAACARLLASKLEKHGIKKSIEVKFDERNAERFYLKYKEVDNSHIPANVSFLGLFDTVGAFGIPINIPGLRLQKLNLFKNLELANNIEQCVHCLALDENREPFIPTLCNQRDHVDELWFAGVHADIGGGYQHSALGNISFNYMQQRLQQHFHHRPIAFKPEALKRYSIESLAHSPCHLHHHGDGIKKAPRALIVSVANQASALKPRIHRSVQRLMAHEQFYIATEGDPQQPFNRSTYRPSNLLALGDAVIWVD